MYRCLFAALSIAAASLVSTAPAWAQVQRSFPRDALRGVMVVTAPPQITLNREVAQLAPGARIRGQNNLQQLSASLVGQKLLVHYTIDTSGQVAAVWILTEAEAAKRPWPETPKQSAAWAFDPVAQSWSKP